MARRIRRIVFPFAVVLVTAAVVLVIAVRPGLQDDAQAVDRAWKPLAAPLGDRYAALEGVADALDTAGAGDREVTRRLRRVLSDWELLAVTTDAAAQAATANELEGLAARVRATVAGAAKLNQDQALTAAIGAFDAADPPVDRVAAYNDAVKIYERSREGFWRGIVASLDDYPQRPTLQLATAA